MNYNFNFDAVWADADRLFLGLLLGLQLAAVAIVIGMVIGLALAVAHVSGGRLVRTVIAAYVEFIRNVPLLLLVYLVFFGIPTIGGFAYGATTSFVMTLAVYAGAQMVEVFRAGLDAVPKGLVDAGKAIGLGPWGRLLYVRLPAMFRIVLPTLSNAFVSLFKDTSIASVIAVPELTYAANVINYTSFRIIEVYAVVTPMYLVTGYGILFGLQRLERRFAISR